MSQELTEGWTGPIDEQLLRDGSPYDITTMTVALILKTKSGALVSTTSTAEVTIFDSTAGIVRYLPTTADLKASLSPYSAKWKVTDSTGRIVFFPSGRPSRWDVYEP